MRKFLGFWAVIMTALTMSTGVAMACGGLIAPNGSVRLLRTSTLVAHHNGIEHYITNFAFSGEAESFGSIVPLPAVPTDVRRAGDWTLQRLEQEVRPAVFEDGRDFATAAGSTGESVEVLLETRIDSLDITVVRGGGQEVAEWARENGFELGDDAPDVLDHYAERSPVFMATRFDAAAAEADNFNAGDGVPIQVTMPTEMAWVPIHILSLGKPDTEIVEADIFLLTDAEPDIFTGRGLTTQVSQAASSDLLDDLRSDTDMGWVPETAWLTHLTVDTPAGELTYDLAADSSPAPTTATDLTARNLADLDTTNPFLDFGPIDNTGAASEASPSGTNMTVVLVALIVMGFLTAIVALLRIPALSVQRRADAG